MLAQSVTACFSKRTAATQQEGARTHDTRLPFMLRTFVKPSLPSCAAYLPLLAPAVLREEPVLTGHIEQRPQQTGGRAYGGSNCISPSWLNGRSRAVSLGSAALFRYAAQEAYQYVMIASPSCCSLSFSNAAFVNAPSIMETCDSAANDGRTCAQSSI